MRGLRESGTYGPHHSSRVTEDAAAAASTLSVLSAELTRRLNLRIAGRGLPVRYIKSQRVAAIE